MIDLSLGYLHIMALSYSGLVAMIVLLMLLKYEILRGLADLYLGFFCNVSLVHSMNEVTHCAALLIYLASCLHSSHTQSWQSFTTGVPAYQMRTFQDDFYLSIMYLHVQ